MVVEGGEVWRGAVQKMCKVGLECRAGSNRSREGKDASEGLGRAWGDAGPVLLTPKAARAHVSSAAPQPTSTRDGKRLSRCTRQTAFALLRVE